MNRIILLVAVSLVAFSCKTSRENLNNNYTELGIIQTKGIENAANTITEKSNDASVLIAAKDSSEIIIIDSKKPIYTFKLVEKQAKINRNPKLLKKYKIINDEPGTTKPGTKYWNIVVSVIFFLAGIIAFLTIPYIGIAIILMALGIILFLLATQKFPAPAEPPYQNLEADVTKKPINIYAKIAFVFFLLSILLLLTIFLGMPLFAIAPFTFLASLLLSISALLNIRKKNNSENGKSLAWTILILSAIPVLIVLIFFILILIFGFGE